jgi:putative hydrolase of the HAD superfamily
MAPLSLIGVDADDTLWHHEPVFRMTHRRFNDLLSAYASEEELERRLAAIERRNLALYGYGAKGFTLSMLETALEVSADKCPTSTLKEVLMAGRELMAHPMEPLPGAREAVEALSRNHRLILITKGDLFHQELKLAASGLGSLFSGVEIVSEKSPDTYARVFERYGVAPQNCLMTGNSVKSDILPVLALGGWAALVPYPLVWEVEAAETPSDHPRFRELVTLADLPGFIAEIEGRRAPADP